MSPFQRHASRSFETLRYMHQNSSDSLAISRCHPCARNGAEQHAGNRQPGTGEMSPRTIKAKTKQMRTDHTEKQAAERPEKGPEENRPSPFVQHPSADRSIGNKPS